MVLFYENEVGNITTLQTLQDSVNPFSGAWTNRTDALYDSLRGAFGLGMELSAPFTSAFVPQSMLTSSASDTEYVCQALFNSNNTSTNQQLVSTMYYPGNETFRSGKDYLIPLKP